MVQLLDLPQEVLENVFLELSIQDLIRCKRVCREFNLLLTSTPALQLHFELQAASLRAPLAIRSRTAAASLLSTLRERQTRFRNFAPTGSYRVGLDQDEGRLYEWLEGHLLRGNGLPTPANEVGEFDEAIAWILGRRRRLPRGVTHYDLTAGEWETIATDSAPVASSSSSRLQNHSPTSGPSSDHTMDTDDEDIEVLDMSETQFDDPEMYRKNRWEVEWDIKDVAMDPGSDLFVAAQVEHVPGSAEPYQLHLNFMRLSDYSKHPDALESGRIEAALTAEQRAMNLIIQICDDRIYLFASTVSHLGGRVEMAIPEARIICWQWTTGQLISRQDSLTTHASRVTGLQTIEDCILLTHNTYLAATYTSTEEVTGGRLAATLNLYYLQPENSNQSVPGHDPLRTPTHSPKLLARFLMPQFENVIQIGLRADPPPRRYFPRHKPLAMYPNPEEGLVIVTFDTDDGQIAFDMENPDPLYYHLFVLKETLLSFLPYLESSAFSTQLELEGFVPLLVPFEELAPRCRFRTDIMRQGWVCFVYGHRFAHFDECSHSQTANHVLLDDFNPRTVRKTIQDRTERLRVELGREDITADDLDGIDETDGIDCIVKESVVPKDSRLKEEIRTGSKLPYISSRDPQSRNFSGVMIDQERVVTILERPGHSQNSFLEVLQF